MGHRATKLVTENGNVTLHQRYIYRGYLQIACIDLTRNQHHALWYITWDVTQPIATRPLAIQINGTWYTYGWDLTKNICELYSTSGTISTTYTYTPFGSVTAYGSLTQPIQWSSEVWDSEIGLVYYNWRCYNALDGRWIGRDKYLDNYIYSFCQNSTYKIDYLGMLAVEVIVHPSTLIPSRDIRIPSAYRDNIFISGGERYYNRVFNNDEGYAFAITTAYANEESISIECQQNAEGKYCAKKISINIHVLIVINMPYIIRNLENVGTYILVPTRNKLRTLPFSSVYDDELDYVRDINAGFKSKTLIDDIKANFPNRGKIRLHKCEENKTYIIDALKEEYNRIFNASYQKYDAGDAAPHNHSNAYPDVPLYSVEEEVEMMYRRLYINMP